MSDAEGPTSVKPNRIDGLPPALRVGAEQWRRTVESAWVHAAREVAPDVQR